VRIELEDFGSGGFIDKARLASTLDPVKTRRDAPREQRPIPAHAAPLALQDTRRSISLAHDRSEAIARLSSKRLSSKRLSSKS
jgi:hypothetical protein